MTTENNTNPETAVPVDQNQKAAANPATQTLFRFVSLRNPQLTDAKENPGFVTRPKEAKGIFDTQLEDWAGQESPAGTKFQQLEQAAAGFETAIKREKDVEKLWPEYYNLGRSLSKKDDINFSGSLPQVDDADLVKLWDNLIYQVVTQKDFYVKEAIIQTLKGIYYAKTYNRSGSKLADQTRDAKVVLPAKLFVEEAPVEDEVDEEKSLFTVGKSKVGSEDSIGGNNSKMTAAKKTHRSLSVVQESRLKADAIKNLVVTNALLRKSALQTLKNELAKQQKSYARSYHKAYSRELAKYQSDVQPIVDSNNMLIDELEAKFDADTTEAAKKLAYKNLPLTEVPRFEFSYKKEINFPDLKSKLDPESFNLFLDLFTEYDSEAILKLSSKRKPDQEASMEILSDTELSFEGEPVALSEDFLSYPDIMAKIDEGISEQSKTALSAVDMPKQQYVNLGGALVPVANNLVKTPQAYFLKASSEKSGFSKLDNLYFSFEVEDDSYSVAYAKITAETDNGTIDEAFDNLPVANNKIAFPAIFANQSQDINSLKIELYFDNGRETVLEFSEISKNISYTGIFDLKSIGNTSGNGMAPKHFGVKRLGIADYLKVEQSIHAYVPGEVSNIENVMASELRHKSISETQRSETITDITKSQEVEKLSDTTKTDRSEMQTEVAKEIDRQQSWEAHTRASGKAWGWSLEVGGSYANSTAQHDSTRQAVAKSQEIMERALERVVTKISEERIQKIFKEVTLQNVHEFDNRGKAASTGSPLPAPPQHITGVYRWVDKKMKNQIYNYGKRTMFEFMIPEPARLHALATSAVKVQLTAPIDPRSVEAKEWQMKDYNVDESFLKHWANEYGVDIPDSLPGTTTKVYSNLRYTQDEYNDQVLSIPDNYVCKSVSIIYSYSEQKNKGWLQFFGYDGLSPILYSHSGTLPYGNLDFEGQLHLRFYQNWLNYTDFNVTQYCELSSKYIIARKKEIFTKIIAAYTAAKEKFDADVKAAAEAAAAATADNKEKVSLFYRDTEANVLKHNCIAYLLQNQLGYGALGQPMSEDGNLGMQSFHMLFGDNLDNYTSLAKFMEQAFEWNIMDYTFYPYYWANKAHWQDLYLTEETDPLFRSFLQAGMARVIVTVKPGFEDAVQFFMTTGRIWNGGEVPVIGDPMYLSIVDELRQPTGKAQGKYWITRVPTTLTILQEGSAGLKVTDALPIFPVKPEEVANCENPDELEKVSAFGKPVDAVMQHGGDTSTLG